MNSFKTVQRLMECAGFFVTLVEKIAHKAHAARAPCPINTMHAANVYV